MTGRAPRRPMTPVGCRPSVGSSGSIFCHHPVQPIYVPQCNVCPWKRTGDAAFVEGVEDRDPQIRACATAFVKVDKRIELELETVRPELFELDRRRRRRHHIRIALRNVQQDRSDFAWIAPTSHAHRDYDAAEIVAKRPILHLFRDQEGIWNEDPSTLGGLDLGRAHADLAHITFLAADHHEVADLDAPLRQEDQTRYEIVVYALQAETDADGERPSHDGEVGEVKAGIGKRSKRRDHDAGIT